MDLSTREIDGQAVVALCGELDVADAASVAAALAAVAARAPEIVVDLAGLEFIDSSGVAAPGVPPGAGPPPRGGLPPCAPADPGPSGLFGLPPGRGMPQGPVRWPGG